jgi:hypothetical protein
VETGPASRAGSADATRPSGTASHPPLMTYEEAVESGIIPKT